MGADSTVYHSAAAASGLHAWYSACRMVVTDLTVRASTLRSYVLSGMPYIIGISGSRKAPFEIQGDPCSGKLLRLWVEGRLLVSIALRILPLLAAHLFCLCSRPGHLMRKRTV